MVEFNKTKGGDIEGQIKNNLAKPTGNIESVFKERLAEFVGNEKIILYYSCEIEIPRLQDSIDDLIKILNAQRELIDEHKLTDISNWGLEDLEGFIHYAPTPLFNLALDKEGYEILAWSDEDDSVVRTPHKTGDA